MGRLRCADAPPPEPDRRPLDARPGRPARPRAEPGASAHPEGQDREQYTGARTWARAPPGIPGAPLVATAGPRPRPGRAGEGAGKSEGPPRGAEDRAGGAADRPRVGRPVRLHLRAIPPLARGLGA